MVSQLLSLLFSLGLLLLLLPAGAQPTAIQELYVKPTEDTSCPEPCHTLDEYVQHTTQYFVSNTAFKFLPGTHDLSQSLIVTGVSNLAMVAHSNGSEVEISCSDVPILVDIKYYNLSFNDISNLTLEGLTTSNCTLRLMDILNLNIVRIRMELRPRSDDYVVDFVTIVSAENTVGHSSIIGFGLDLPTFLYDSCSVPPLVVSFNDRNFSWPLPSYNQLTIKNSDISVPDLEVQGISIELNQSTYNVSIVVENVTASSTCNVGVTMRIGSAAHNAITVKNLQPTSTTPQQLTVADHMVSGTSNSNTIVHISDCWLQSVSFSVMSTQVIFEDSFVQHYHYSAFFKASGCDITVKNVTFSDIQRYGLLLPPGTDGVVQISCGTNVSFINCKFHNFYNTEDLPNEQRLPIVSLANSRGINFINCDFSNNRGTAIHSVDSSYTLSGSNTFSNNSAYRGGAMAFYGQSYVTFSDGSSTIFENNSADTVGGAIYVDYGINSPCFVQGNICNHLINLKFGDNEAKVGGGRVYGASFDTCSVSNHCCGMNYMYCDGSTIASRLFDFDPRNTSDFSAITSDPLRACLCEDGRPSCTTVFSKRTHYPGETFNFSAVVVGDRFGTVDGSVYAQLLPDSGRVAELGSLQSSQHVQHSQCTNVSYTVFSNGSSETITLTARIAQIQSYPNALEVLLLEYSINFYNNDGTIGNDLRTFPVYINITLLPCPLGFMLSGQSHGCICDTQLQNNHIHCDLSTQTVQRSGTKWVNASFHGNSSNGVIVSKYCPNNYCKPETVDVNLEHPDTQCAFNHSGILCGGCQSGLSLALGSPQCLHCSNDYLALLIPFALAGLLLMFFIKLLNLSVAVGSLNGLLFYANIVQANQLVWNLAETNILRVFIAWLNLDLGIMMCFFSGLNAYWKTWLQFVFPLYIWTIVILTIVLSRYFSIAARILGSNSVSILATLFLLSYPKLLRTIISIFQFSTLHHPDGQEIAVWSYDGNIAYLGSKHLPLFLIGFIVILFLWLPYTGTLLYAQCLQRSSNYRVGKVLAKLKPFLDAYFGPLRDKHRYWVGLLLLVRGILFVVISATATRYSEVNLVITLVAAVSIMVYLIHVGGVYKSIYLNLLEISFFLNLAVLAGGTLLIGKNQSTLHYTGLHLSALLSTTLSIAFVEFAVIVLIHAITCLNKTGLGHKLRHFLTPAKLQAAVQDARNDGLENEPGMYGAAAQRLVMSYDDFREPILKYMDSQS